MKNLIFVYGTLKSGMPLNHFLNESRLIGDAITIHRWYMVQTTIPFMCHGDVAQVMGEVWEVDDETLKALDWVEGHPVFYQREMIDVIVNRPELHTDEEMRVWAYILPNDKLTAIRNTVPTLRNDGYYWFVI